MKNTAQFLILLLAFSACGQREAANEEATEAQTGEESAYPVTGSIEVLDPAIHEIIPEGAKIEVIGEGFNWTEGPVWVPGEEMLLFSDIPPNSIFKWKEGEGVSLFLTPSGYTGSEERGGEVGSNGLILDLDGNLVLCQHGDRRMARLKSTFSEPEPNFETIVDNYQGKKLNSPNDAVYKSDGTLYFTDPPYGLEKNADDPAKELNFQGVFMVSLEGQTTLLTDELSRPNGIAFSPNEEILYVANSDPKKAIWMAYDVQGDGTIANGRVFYDVTDKVGKEKGLPDGMKVDSKGNIYGTGPGGVLIFSPEGKHLGTIKTGEATSNCAFGDDGNTLYMTADDYLMMVRLKEVNL